MAAFPHLNDSDWTQIGMLLPVELEGQKSALDTSPRKNWVERAGGLPHYVVRMALDLIEAGFEKSHAIATTINAVKKACATGDLNFPGVQHENKISRAEACAAAAHWEAMKASH